MFRIVTLALLLTTTLASAQERPAGQSQPSPGPALKAPRIPESVPVTLRPINEKLLRGVDPAENAAIDLLQLLGVDALDENLRADTLEMLGVAALSVDSPRFLVVTPFIQSLGVVTDDQAFEAATLLETQLHAGIEKPWSGATFPLLFQYVTKNEKALDGVAVAVRKPRYFVPLLSEDTPPELIGASLAIERRLPFIGRNLAARALLRAHDEKFDLAIADLCAAHRMATVLAAGSPLDVSAAKANLIDSLACHAALGMLQNSRIPGDRARAYLRELENIAAIPPAAVQSDLGERAIIQQALALLLANEAELREFFATPEGADAPEVDGKIAQERADEVQDQLVRALSTLDRDAQAKRYDELDRDYRAWEESVDSTMLKFASADKRDIEVVSRFVGETMARSFKPPYRYRRTNDDRSRVRRDLVRIGLALAAYRSDHDDYPETLEALAPALLKEVPLDGYTDKPFFYERLAPLQARLITWGANGMDDAGKTYNDDLKVELR